MNNNDKNINNNPKGIKPPKRGIGYYITTYGFLILLVVAVVAMLIFNNSNYNTKEMDINTVISKINSGEISCVYLPNGSEKGRVLLTSASSDDAKKFPDKYEFWFVLNSSNVERITEAVEIRGDTDGDGNLDVKIVNATTPVNVFSYIMPVLYVLILLLSLFMIYRFLSRAGGKGGNFGKGKIKNGQMSKIRFENVAGIDEEKVELEEIVDFLKNPKKYTELGARIPKGVLLVGDPGTGKTLLAKAIAGESNVPFFSMSGSDFVEMFVGVGASRVRELFQEAKKNAPCLVFIDEIDAVGRRRGTGLGGGNDEREQTLNQLLVEMDGFEANEGIIIIAATNRADVLDPALTRPGRFDRTVVIYPPDIKGREQILQIHAKNKILALDVDLKVIAKITSGFTGANLENLMNEAALRAAQNNKREISMVDITESINKVTLGVQKKSRVLTEDDKKITAYHEAGHALVSLLQPNTGEVQEVSIIPRGFAGGYTYRREDDHKHTTYTKLDNEIAICMGGRVAEQIVFGEVTCGASNDIVQATKIAKAMVTQYGMSDSLGFINLADNEDMFDGGGVRKNASISEHTANIVDEEVRKILKRNYDKTVSIISEKREILDEIVKVLLERETVYKEELDKLMAGEKAENVIKDILEKENAKKLLDQEQAIIEDSSSLLDKAIKNKQSLETMLASNLVNQEQYDKFFADLKNEYNKEREEILKLIDSCQVAIECKKALVEFENVEDLDDFYVSITTESFKKIANENAIKNGKPIPYPDETKEVVVDAIDELIKEVDVAQNHTDENAENIPKNTENNQNSDTNDNK